MKKVLIICGAVILVAVIGLLSFLLSNTKSELSATKNDLNNKVDELVSLTSKLEQSRTELNNLSDELNKLNGELDNTKNTLVLTKQELSDTKNELDSTKTDLSAARTEMDEFSVQYDTMKSNYDGINTSLENTKKDLESANTTIEQLNKNIDLYKETFGEVYGGINSPITIPDTQPPDWDLIINEDGSVSTWDYINSEFVLTLEEPPATRPVNLMNNPEAKNPTYEKLLNFLEEDKTDKNRYASNYYESGNFAETIHNNAEASGIRAAFVVVDFDNGRSHALNAFITVYTAETKLIYIDCTGHFEKAQPPSLDTTLPYLKFNSRYWRKFLLDVSWNWRFYEDDSKVTNIKIYW
jgi:outer membrane murein-binding lipoprotein Lpp